MNPDLQRAIEALELAQNQLAPNKAQAFVHGSLPLWNIYEEAITGLLNHQETYCND